jgi:NAD(P)-dependent dehydrogenase (short-subunit alcohol dehydrogenase family)
MQIQGNTAFVTGANRGIGHALVRGLLECGASRIYATAFPDPMSKSVYAQWVADHKGVERQFASM